MKAATQPDNCVNNETLWFPERFLKFITQYIAFWKQPAQHCLTTYTDTRKYLWILACSNNYVQL